MQNEKRSDVRLILRMLMPSVSSIVGSLLVMLSLIGFHLLTLSNQPDLFLPHAAGESNDQLVKVYEKIIIGPLDNLFGNNFMGVLSTVLVWGVIGWVVYFLIDFGLMTFQEWRQSDEDIAYVGKNQVVRHPLFNQALIRITVRFIVGMLAIAGLFAFRPFISFLFENDIKFLSTGSSVEMLKYAAIGMLGWMLILHIYVVLLRLFSFRTRVFGEIIS